MPELGKLNPYGLRGETGYDPRAFNYGPAPALTPNTEGVSRILGGAKSLSIVSDTLAKLPALITDAYKKGQRQTEENIAHQLKMGVLANGLTDDVKIGADNSVTINPEDPYTRDLKNQGVLANIEYRRAMTAKAGQSGAQPGLWEDEDETPAAPPAGGALARPTSQTDALGNPLVTLPPGSPATGPLTAPPDVAPDFNEAPSMPTGGGALSQGFLKGAALGAETPQGALGWGVAQANPPPADVLPPLPEGDIAPPAETTQGLTFQKGNRAQGRPAQWFNPDGSVAAIQAPGMKTPHFLPRAPKPAQTAEDAAAKAAQTTEARELALRGHSAAEILTMTDAQKRAELAKPKTSAIRQPTASQLNTAIKFGLDVDLVGKDANQAAAAIQAAMKAKGYEISPEQMKQYNTMVAQMSRNPILKTAGTANIGYESVLAGYEQKNGFGDLAMVDGLLRLVNPSMGVTGHAADSVAQGIPVIEKYTGLALDKIMNGDQLTDQARDRIVKLAKELRERENVKRKGAIDAYIDSSKGYGFTPQMVERAEKDALAMFAMNEQEGTQATTAPGAAGTVMVTKGGKSFVIDEKKLPAFTGAGWTEVK